MGRVRGEAHPARCYSGIHMRHTRTNLRKPTQIVPYPHKVVHTGHRRTTVHRI